MVDYKTKKIAKRSFLKKLRKRKANLKGNGLQTIYKYMPFLICIVVVIAILLLCQIPQVNDILNKDINIINMLIGVMSLILSGFAVYYGRKAYRVAQDIFEKGIQINKKKVLDEASWEFVSDFFIPLSKLYLVTKAYFPIIEGRYCPQDNPVEDVYNELKSIKLPSRFSYWELHKRDIFDALDIDDGLTYGKTGEQHQINAFLDIFEFVDKALELQNKINAVIEFLKKNKSVERDGRSKRVRLDELFNKDIYGKINYELDELFHQMETLKKYVNTLPQELNIKYTILLLNNE